MLNGIKSCWILFWILDKIVNKDITTQKLWKIKFGMIITHQFNKFSNDLYQTCNQLNFTVAHSVWY